MGIQTTLVWLSLEGGRIGKRVEQELMDLLFQRMRFFSTSVFVHHKQVAASRDIDGFILQRQLS